MKLICTVKSKKHTVVSILSGLCYSFIFVFGYYLEKKGGLDFSFPSFWIHFVLGVVAFSGLFFIVLNLSLITRNDGTAFCNVRGDSKSVRRFSFVVFALLFITYVIWLLGTYPGYFAYDAPTQWDMFCKKEITAHHPVIHTLLIGWSLKLGEAIGGTINKGAFIYSFGQMIVSIASFTAVLTFMYKRGAKKIFLVLSFLWFAFYPTVIINVLATTKDSLFAPFNLVFMILTIRLLTEEEDFWSKKRYPILWVLFTFLCTITRNNAVYPMAIFTMALFIRACIRKAKPVKRYLSMILSVCVLLGLYNGPFCKNVCTSGLNPKEFFSIPIQQVLWVYMNENDSMTTDEKAIVEDMFTERSFIWYHPKIADIGKYDFKIEKFDANKNFYIDYWINLGKKFPKEYLNAFLSANIGLWYPETTLMIDYKGREAYAVCHSYSPIVDDSFFPAIFDYLQQFEESDWLCQKDATKWIFAPATIFCLFLAITIVTFSRKKAYSILLGYMLLFWMTFLLGPVALVRYVSFLFYSIPLLFWIFIQTIKEEK